MKLIISGGRNYKLGPEEWDWLDRVAARLGPIEQVVTGGATGADTGGAEWAASHCIPVVTFLPEWAIHGRAAGPVRNRLMAAYCTPGGVAVLFPGGRGTISMKREALSFGLRVFEYALAVGKV